jgi:hypothetical protein
MLLVLAVSYFCAFQETHLQGRAFGIPNPEEEETFTTPDGTIYRVLYSSRVPQLLSPDHRSAGVATAFRDGVAVVDLSPLVDADLRGHFLPTIITMADGRDVLVLNMYLPIWSGDGATRKRVMALIKAWWWKHGVALGLPSLMVGDVNAGWVATDRKGGVRNNRDQHYKTWVGEMSFLPFDTRQGRPHTFHKGPMGISRIDDWLYWVPSNTERSPPFPNSQVVVLEEIPCGGDHYPLRLTFGAMATGQSIEVGDGVGECVEQPGDGGDSCDEGYASGESSDGSYLSDEGYASGD